MLPSFQPAAESNSVLRVSDPEVKASPSGEYIYTFSLMLERREKPTYLLHTVSYTSTVPIECPSGIGNSAFITALFPAMALGVPVKMEAPVSPALLHNAERLQEVYSSWWPRYKKVDVDVRVATPTEKVSTGKTGMYFSAGVDGFHTLQQHANEVSTLVFNHGFDIQLDKLKHRSAIENVIQKIADDMGKPLVLISTNARSFSDPYVWWGEYCGSLLGASTCLLEGQLDTLLIASSFTAAGFVPFGSTPLTDPFYSTEYIRSIHSESTFSRNDKMKSLLQWDYAMQHLRVCWRMEGSADNCCTCEKCLRTMTALWLKGVLDRCPTFKLPLMPEAIDALAPLDPTHRELALENVNRMQEAGLEVHPVAQAWKRLAERSLGEKGVHDLTALKKEIEEDPLPGLWPSLHAQEILQDAAFHAPKALYREVSSRVPESLNRSLGQRDPAVIRRNVLRLLSGYARFTWKRIVS